MPNSKKPRVGRRGFLKGAVAGAAGLVAKPQTGSAQQQPVDHDHDHQVVPSDPALRTKALESLLVQKGLVDPAALDARLRGSSTAVRVSHPLAGCVNCVLA